LVRTAGDLEREQHAAFGVIESVLDDRTSVADGLVRLGSPEFRLSGLHRRLLSALAGQARGCAGDGDVATLLGAVLRREANLWRKGRQPSVQVSAAVWDAPFDAAQRSSLTVARLPGGTSIAAEPWRPAWLDSAAPLEPVDALEGRSPHQRRPPADPFFEAAVGHTTYASEGQQAAARCVALAPPGSTTVAALPTGTGKSAVGLLQALRADVGTGVVVVPTVSLVADQETELRSLLAEQRSSRRLAHQDFGYLGRSPDATKAAIRDRIRDGSQGVVIAAPEALPALAPALRHAAAEGRLTAFVVDEAHAVTGWGDDFRPAFQAMAGIRRSLLDATPEGREFATVLLSATLRQHDLAVLRKLFEPTPRGIWLEAHEFALRPEAEIWTVACGDGAERDRRVVEAALHLPRPGIIYVNRPSRADVLVELLRRAGVYRTAAYTGPTSPSEREWVEQRWRDVSAPAEVDLVVATSAFGLGINQGDVRAVIHACIPDGAARYYQEVGRAGRDGRAAISLVLTADADEQEARGLATKTYPNQVTDRRWRSMHDRRVAAGPAWPGVTFVDIADINPTLAGAGADESRRNEVWNGLVLTLLQQAELIRLDEPVGAERPANMSRPVGVRVLRGDMFSTDWEAAWRRVREAGKEAAQADIDCLLAILSGSSCAGELFSATFAVDGHASGTTCPGCPWCRSVGAPPALAEPRTVIIHRGPDIGVIAPLARLVGSRRVALLTADRDGRQAKALRGVIASIAAAYPVIVYGDDAEPVLADVHPSVRDSIARESLGSRHPAGIPGTVEIVLGTGGDIPKWTCEPPPEGVTRLIIVPPDAPSPLRPERTVSEHLALPLMAVEGVLEALR
jgi:superfamily II DNA/RNA helicase